MERAVALAHRPAETFLLNGMQAGKQTAACQQLGARTLLDKTATIQHGYVIGARDSAKPMRDDNYELPTYSISEHDSSMTMVARRIDERNVKPVNPSENFRQVAWEQLLVY
jgi:hypothetical protein